MAHQSRIRGEVEAGARITVALRRAPSILAALPEKL